MYFRCLVVFHFNHSDSSDGYTSVFTPYLNQMYFHIKRSTTIVINKLLLVSKLMCPFSSFLKAVMGVSLIGTWSL